MTIILLLAATAHADTPPPIQLEKCLQRADDLPDMAAAESAVWIKNGGGNDAHLCRAFAQANRGMYADAAREFWALASLYEKQKSSRAIAMHNLSGQEFLRAKDAKNAEMQYTAALKMAPANVEALIGRAEARMATDRYWDALGDLNQALKTDPNNIKALRQRGRAWTQLGNAKNAQEDFEHVEALTGEHP